MQDGRRQGRQVYAVELAEAFQQWAGPIDDDLSLLLIKMAVSSWIEQVLIERVGIGVGHCHGQLWRHVPALA